ncbi:MAG: chemotaxis protein CheW [Rhizobacter sp.]
MSIIDTLERISTQHQAGAAGPRIAPPAADESVRARAGEYLSFRIGNEEYALDILKVQEIRSYEPPTRMAGSPACIKGVVNLRGTIVPVVDLRVLVGSNEPLYDTVTAVIVLNVSQRIVGVVVDAVSDVVALSDSQIRPLPALGESGCRRFWSGIALIAQPTEARQRMLILTDVDRLLWDPLIGLADATPTQPLFSTP